MESNAAERSSPVMAVDKPASTAESKCLVNEDSFSGVSVM